MSSRELKTSKLSLVLRTRENSDVFKHSMKYIWYSPQNYIGNIEFSLVLRTREALMFSTHSIKYIWYLPKKVNNLCTYFLSVYFSRVI